MVQGHCAMPNEENRLFISAHRLMPPASVVLRFVSLAAGGKLLTMARIDRYFSDKTP
jgi:hypothetical protein